MEIVREGEREKKGRGVEGEREERKEGGGQRGALTVCIMEVGYII